MSEWVLRTLQVVVCFLKNTFEGSEMKKKKYIGKEVLRVESWKLDLRHQWMERKAIIKESKDTRENGFEANKLEIMVGNFKKEEQRGKSGKFKKKNKKKCN